MTEKKKETVVRNFKELGEAWQTRDLPDLGEIKVSEMTDQEKKKIEAEYQQRRGFAEEAAKKLAAIDREIEEIEADREKLDLTPSLQKRLEKLKEVREKLLVEDEGVRKHTEFAAFLEEIRKAKPKEAGRYVEEAVQKGRLQETTQTNRPNLLYWRGKVYEPAPDSAGKVTSASLALVTELRRLTNAAKKEHRQTYLEKVKDLKARATLTWQDLNQQPVPIGLIYGYLPPRKNPAGEVELESHFLVECDGKVLRPVEAIGRLKNLWTRLRTQERYVSVSDFLERRIRGGRLPEQVFKDLQSFSKILRAAMAQEKPRVKSTAKPVTKPESSVEQGPEPESAVESSSGSTKN